MFRYESLIEEFYNNNKDDKQTEMIARGYNETDYVKEF
jgi:hypothetical protein